MKSRSEEMALVSHRIPPKIASVNYTSFARAGIENLQPWARGYDAISHSGRHILGCNFLFENLQLVCAWKLNICLKTEHQRQSCRKKRERLSLYGNLLLKKPKTNLRTSFSPATFLKCQLTTGLENNCLYGEARDRKPAPLVFLRNRLQIHILQN